MVLFVGQPFTANNRAISFRRATSAQLRQALGSAEPTTLLDHETSEVAGFENPAHPAITLK
jgi:hypothetical protein